MHCWYSSLWGTPPFSLKEPSPSHHKHATLLEAAKILVLTVAGHSYSSSDMAVLKGSSARNEAKPGKAVCSNEGISFDRKSIHVSVIASAKVGTMLVFVVSSKIFTDA